MTQLMLRQNFVRALFLPPNHTRLILSLVVTHMSMVRKQKNRIPPRPVKTGVTGKSRSSRRRSTSNLIKLTGKSVRKTQESWNPYNRYAGALMLDTFSDQYRHRIWRRLWTELARCQMASGLPVTQIQVAEMEQHLDDIDYKVVSKIESQTRHDVMAHVKAFGLKAKKAAPIIHLGATSCYVTDNSDLIIYREALKQIEAKLGALIESLGKFAKKTKALPTLGFTHFQVAQPTTVGKRATLWLQDLVMDFNGIAFVLDNFKFRSIRGATGTQASFLKLFGGDSKKVYALEIRLAKSFGFEEVFGVSGQTYTRKLDFWILNALASLGTTLSKMAHDLRLLQNLDEIGEGFGRRQIGSSTMAFKQNPMKAERLTGITRFLLTLPLNAAFTAGTQWLERSLDDSANRRIVMPQGFLAADACLNIAADITKSLVVNEGVIKSNLRTWVPYLISEDLIMEGVKRGGDRQKLHEIVRRTMIESRTIERQGTATRRRNYQGTKKNQIQSLFLEKLARHREFNWIRQKRIPSANKLVGLAEEQVDRYLKTELPAMRLLSKRLKLPQPSFGSLSV